MIDERANEVRASIEDLVKVCKKQIGYQNEEIKALRDEISDKNSKLRSLAAENAKLTASVFDNKSDKKIMITWVLVVAVVFGGIFYAAHVG